ncbi:unnamed protein product [Kuraishia capsulata CBS 1993]|uniref:Glycosyltransferase family 32 protein n=1 Tax=Kuraishia capsulata CBS 1993 TaxID=1382522 RepID=W6MQR1_9ASCO|nr:uncharacterized protein KUCA_T00004987001 [Kuraishia capsulata CBS 1993]CDK29001.1 unnamed protein product [Kuraishia capsulata CBS 1993]
MAFKHRFEADAVSAMNSLRALRLNSRLVRSSILVLVLVSVVLFVSSSPQPAVGSDGKASGYSQAVKSSISQLFDKPNPYETKVTEARLARQFPFDKTPRPIEKNIWQMWKVKPSDPDFPQKDFVNQWKNDNPTYNYNFLTDDEILAHLRLQLKDTVPEVLEAFEMLPTKILKSDFSRYLMVYLNGGLYSDADTQLYKPVDQWFDSNKNVGFVVGIEEDINAENWENYMTRRIQFEQWTLKAKARHPLLRKLIARITKVTFDAQKRGHLVAYYKDFKGVDKCKSVNIMEWTGPVIWTDTIYDYLNSLTNPTVVEIDPERTYKPEDELYGPEIGPGENFNWKFFAGVKAPIMIDDVVIYPRLSFRDDISNNCGKYCYVFHWFGGSWKNNGKGEVKPGDEKKEENKKDDEKKEKRDEGCLGSY